MRVFVTGAAGYIGQATVKELTKHGHEVVGLARSDANVKILKDLGAEPHMGDLKNLESLKTGASSCDGVLHLGFVHDFQNYNESCATDRAAISAMGEALTGTGKPLIIAAGTLSCKPGPSGYADEDTKVDMSSPLTDREKSAHLIAELSKNNNIRGAVVRLAPTVHFKGDKAFIPMIINACREKGVVPYVEGGVWPAVHRDDAAVVLRLILEKGRSGATYNALGEYAVSLKDVAEVIGKRLNLPVEKRDVQGASEVLGFFGPLIGVHNPTSSEKTQKELGWTPSQPGLIADMEANYF